MKLIGIAALLMVFSASAFAIEIPPGLSDMQTIEFLIPHFNAKTGRTLEGAEVVLWDGTSDLDGPMQVERERAEREGWYAFTIPTVRNTAGRWSAAEVSPVGMHTCFIAVFTSGDYLVGRSRQTVLAHELYHCYQFQKLGTAGKIRAPGWLIEGGANYVGESTVGGSVSMGESWWSHYLSERTALSDRTYDSFGFFFHLEGHGLDPWQIMEHALADDIDDRPLRLGHLFSRLDADALATWPMSLARKPEWSTEWEAQGKDIPRRSVYPAEHDLLSAPSYRMDVDFSLVKHLALTVATNEPLRIRLENAVGGLRIEGEGGALIYQTKLGRGDTRSLCISEYCGCPDGDDAINLISARGARRIVFAAVGTQPGLTGHIVIERAESHCCTGSARLDPRMVGTWALELRPVLDNFMPPERHPGSSRSATGAQTVRVSRNGAFYKETHAHLAEEYIERNIPTTFTYDVTGTVQGCLETQPYPGYPGRFSFKLTQVVDATDTHWLGIAGDSTLPGYHMGEEITFAWGPRAAVTDPNSDQSGYGQWVDNAQFTIRGPVRQFTKQ